MSDKIKIIIIMIVSFFVTYFVSKYFVDLYNKKSEIVYADNIFSCNKEIELSDVSMIGSDLSSSNSRLSVIDCDFLSSEISLGNSADAYASFSFKIKNNYSVKKTFVKFISEKSDVIGYKVVGIENYEELKPGEERNIILTFYYKEYKPNNGTYISNIEVYFDDVCKITLHHNANSELDKSFYVVKNSSLSKIPAATREGYNFLGWYKDRKSDDSVKLSLDTKFTNDVDFYAHWEPKTYVISFDSNGGSSVDDITRKYDEKIGKMPIPIKEGFVFLGWFTEKENGDLIVETTIVRGNGKLYAHWALEVYLVSFDSQGGKNVQDRNITRGGVVGTLPILSRAGYEFLGWYTAKTGGQRIDENTIINSNMIFFAQWKAITGWSGKTYYTNGTFADGLTKIGNDYYYFDSKTGKYVTGFKDIDSSYRVYFAEDGKMVTGDYKIGNYYYHFDENDGRMFTNSFKKDSKGTKYYNNSGQQVFGQEKIKNAWYYFDETTGYMLSDTWKWIANQKKLVFYKSDGTMAKGSYTYKGVTYSFDNITGAVKPKETSTGFMYYQTNAIVSAHRYDFNVKNFNNIINNYGGYENYVKSLGGIFTKYANKGRVNITTVTEFQEIADYVWGMMTMYGFDYSNSSSSNYGYWGGMKSPAADAFYPSGSRPPYGVSNQDEKYRLLTADDVFSGKGAGMTNMCTGGVTWVLKKAGLIAQDAPTIESEFYGNKSWHKYYRNKGAYLFTDQHKVQPGDVIGFYKGSYPSGYYHVALVVRVDKKSNTYTCYDAGHYFTNKRKHYWVSSLDKNPNQSYGGSDYRIMRLPFNLK